MKTLTTRILNIRYKIIILRGHDTSLFRHGEKLKLK